MADPGGREGRPLRVLWLLGEAQFPPRSGAAIYSQGTTTRLACREDLDLTVAVRACEGPAPAHVAIGQASLGERLRYLVATGPLSGRKEAARGGSGSIATLITEHRPDVAVVDHIKNSFAVPLFKAAGVPVVYASQNVDSQWVAQSLDEAQGTSRLKLAIDRQLTARAEALLLDSSELVLTITDQDAAAFRSMGAKETLVVRPRLSDLYQGEPVAPRVQRQRSAVVAGSFHWHVKRHNIETFAADLSAQSTAPGVLRIAGAMAPGLESHLGSLGPQIEVLANPANMLEIVEQSMVGVVPEFVGGGFKLKWLDYAMAGVCPAAAAESLAGLPVAALDAVATASSSKDLVAMVLQLLDNPAECVERAEAFQRAIFEYFQNDDSPELAHALHVAADSKPSGLFQSREAGT